MGADSGEVPFSLIGASVHPSIDYVSFDFLCEVGYYVLDWLFFDVQFDGRVSLVVDNFKRGKLNGGDCFSGVGSDDVCEALP